jgi:putative toxin-antitoxin system antitoxin component (TIGR02293 family)
MLIEPKKTARKAKPRTPAAKAPLVEHKAEHKMKNSGAKMVPIAGVRIKNTTVRRREKGAIAYDPKTGVPAFVATIRGALPMQLVEVERRGVGGRLLKDIALNMAIPASRLFDIIGVPKATAEKKASNNGVIAGAGGQAALGMVRLLGIAQSIVENSTADEARGFDAAKWLGQWIDRPQPALGGKKPAELLDTPTGIEVVSRILGAIESGAYL